MPSSTSAAAKASSKCQPHRMTIVTSHSPKLSSHNSRKLQINKGFQAQGITIEFATLEEQTQKAALEGRPFTLSPIKRRF
jgi:hypothetical protein